MKHFTPQEYLSGLVWAWLESEIDDPCIDNCRIAREGDSSAMELYDEQILKGCCGSADMRICIDGEVYWIGCNYGH